MDFFKYPELIDMNQDQLIDDVIGLKDEIKDCLKQHYKFENLWGNQIALWKALCGGEAFYNDICLCSTTGTGKTIAYALPIIQNISTYSIENIHFLRAVIVVYSRSLAFQAYNDLKQLCMDTGLSLGVLGAYEEEEEDKMFKIIESSNLPVNDVIDRQIKIDVLITTLDRFQVTLEKIPDFSLEFVDFLVLDEYDEMMKEKKQVEHIKHFINKLHDDKEKNIYNEKRVLKILSSATLFQNPSLYAELKLKSPLLLTINEKQRYILPKTLKQYKILVTHKLKPLVLVGLLKYITDDKTLIFVRHSSNKMLEFLSSLNMFGKIWCYNYTTMLEYCDKDEPREIIIANDGMARGIDFKNVKYIINYDFPKKSKTHIHRCGRTARKGNAGVVYTLIIRDSFEEELFKKIENKMNLEVERYTPDIEELRKLKPTVDASLKYLDKRH